MNEAVDDKITNRHLVKPINHWTLQNYTEYFNKLL